MSAIDLPADRATDIRCARVYLAESRRRGRQPFAWTLLNWAANARKRASAAPRQTELFA